MSAALSFLDAPTALEGDWPSAEHFLGGSGIIADILDGKLVVWGGEQQQDDRSIKALPNEAVYTYDLAHQSFRDGNITGTWKRMMATGRVHSSSIHATSVLCDNILYIFGGKKGDSELTDYLSTLSSSGRFERLRPKGDVRPPPTYRAGGWSYGGRIYFLGGLVHRIDETRPGDYVKCWSEFYTKDLYQYDPVRNEFFLLATTGVGPSPRSDFGVAIIDDQVYVHGGHSGPVGRPLSDFFVLDMKSLRWTVIKETGFSSRIDGHSLSTISASQLLLIGGISRRRCGSSSSTASWKVFNVNEAEWSEEEPLSPTFGFGGALMSHRAVTRQEENGVTVICVGGRLGSYYDFKHPDHMAVLEFPP